MTAFHIALSKGYIPIVNYYIKNHSPTDESYDDIYKYEPESLLRLAIRSGEPEVVWMILENKMALYSDINDAWSWFSSTKGQSVVKEAKPDNFHQCLEEIRNLLLAYGGFTPPTTPRSLSQKLGGKLQFKEEETNATKNRVKYKRGSGMSVRNPPPPAPPSPLSDSPQQFRASGEERRGGRGRGHGRGRGRGRGVARA
jgi:hypothetical protein